MKKVKINNPFFNDAQRGILKQSRISNSEEYSQWIYKNVYYPLIIILIPYGVSFLISGTQSGFRSLIFNGSISLIGLNILFGMSSYLIKFFPKENDSSEGKRKFNEDAVYLRDRLLNYSNFLVFFGAICYLLQTLFDPYYSNIAFYIFAFLILMTLIGSVIIGRYIFMIKDDFMEKAFNELINEGVESQRKSLAKKYG